MSQFIDQHPVLFTTFIFLIIIIIYIIVVARSSNSVIKSARLSTGKQHADMMYYLPTATLTITATAKITITKDSNNTIISANLADLSLENTVAIVPDTKFCFAVNYQPNCFMNDDVRITTNSIGLLDSVSTTTDDQINNIIKQIGDSPAQVLGLKPADVGLVLSSNINTSTLMATKIFHIGADQLKGQSFECPWLINADGTLKMQTNADASFKLTFDRPANYTPIGEDTISEQDGLFTRLATILSVKVELKNKQVQPAIVPQFEVIIPDASSLVTIAVKRASFVKRVNTPRFANGMMTENYINMPSQFEGFISIPINIAKAIISIPGAIFNFKIHHKYDNQLAELDMQRRLAIAEKQAQQTAPLFPIGKTDI